MNKIISLNDLWNIYNLPSHFIAVITPEGLFDKVNETFSTVLGYWEENLIGRPFAELIHPDDQPNDVKEFSREDETEYSHQSVKRVRAVDGSYRFLNFHFTRPAGAEFIYAVAQDCTDKMELEEILRLSSLKQKSPHGISVIDENKRIRWVNESFTRITGYNRSDVVNKNIFTTLSGPISFGIADNDIENKIAGGAAFTHQCICYHKTGTPLWMRMQAQPLFDTATGAAKWFIIHTDITTGNKEKIDECLPPVSFSSLELSHTPGFLSDYMTGSIVYANEAAADIYGYTEETLCSMKIDDLFLDAEAAPVNLFRGTSLPEHLPGYHCFQKTKDGDIIKTEVEYSVCNYNGLATLLSRFKDVTQEHLDKSETDDHSDCLRDIAWKQSHLMRSPLTNLKSLMVFLKEEPENKQYMQYMESELDKLDNVIKEMVYQTSLNVRRSSTEPVLS